MDSAIREGLGERLVDELMLVDERQPVEPGTGHRDVEVITGARAIDDVNLARLGEGYTQQWLQTLHELTCIIGSMPKYLIYRTFSLDISPEDMPGVGSKSRTIIRDQFPDVVWEHSLVALDDDGHVRTVCVYGAPSEEAIRGHAEALGDHEVEGIYEIAGDVTPEDFPYLEQSA